MKTVGEAGKVKDGLARSQELLEQVREAERRAAEARKRPRDRPQQETPEVEVPRRSTVRFDLD